MFFFRRKPAPTPPPVRPPSPPLTADEFIARFRRNYVNYAALIDVAFAGGDDMDDEYMRLSPEDMHLVVLYAKVWAQRA